MVPFNPVDKKTTAKVVSPDGKDLIVTKGAPQVPFQQAHLCAKLYHSLVAVLMASCLRDLALITMPWGQHDLAPTL